MPRFSLYELAWGNLTWRNRGRIFHSLLSFRVARREELAVSHPQKNSSCLERTAKFSRCKTIALAFLLFTTTVPSSTAKDKPAPPTVRWDESTPGCTFSQSEDGKYHYGLWSGSVGVIITIDSQELAKVRRRNEPFFGVLIDVRFRGPGEFDVSPDNATLEFVKHFKLVQPALDSERFSEKIQAHADDLDRETAHEIEKHPEQKESKETFARAYQKDTAELIEFVSKDSLRSAHLDAGNPEATGWLLFSTNSKWISNWKKQEEFLLRLPLDGKIFEFPFKLPPKEGELLLRHRD